MAPESMPTAVISGMYVSAHIFALCIHSDTPERLTVAALLTSAFTCASGIKNGPLILPLRLIQIVRHEPVLLFNRRYAMRLAAL